ncbi:MAG: DUF92 domain-containing protein [Anaerolinea sp.]|nr:DUF92 domain-containing protein [Anaerolinea sp.]
MIFPSTISIIIGLIFGITIAALAYKVHSLSGSGAIAAALLGTIVFGVGGLPYTAILLVFFISSSLLSRLFKGTKKGVSEMFSKGSRRDVWQVLANGGAAGLLTLMSAIFVEQTIFWWLFCASLAAANADTWATELGVLSPTRPRLITTLEPVDMGASGGITLIGTVSALAGAGFIAIVATFFTPSLSMILLVTGAGLVGSLVDSALGASIQGIFYCDACNQETEKHPRHGCGNATRLIRGWDWLNNDWVNTACTVSAPVLLGMIWLLLS